MTLADATHTYSILTIGDGLVSQIPAILATIAAGLVVTRTAGEEDDKHLGDAITRQISGQPRVMLITGLLALLMTLVPGLPKLVCAVLGIARLTLSAWRYRHQFELLRRAFRVPEEEMVQSRKTVDSDELAPPAPLQLEIAPSLAALLGGEGEARGRVAGLAQGMREEYGVPIPVPQVRISPALGEGEYRLTAH